MLPKYQIIFFIIWFFQTDVITTLITNHYKTQLKRSKNWDFLYLKNSELKSELWKKETATNSPIPRSPNLDFSILYLPESCGLTSSSLSLPILTDITAHVYCCHQVPMRTCVELVLFSITSITISLLEGPKSE